MARLTFIYTGSNYLNPVTGGQLYEKQLRDALSEFPDIEMDCQCTMPVRSKLKRLLHPLTSLKLVFRKDMGDVVIFNSASFAYYLPAFLLLRLKGKKTVAIHHHFLHRQFKGARRVIYRALENLFMHSASKVIVPNPYVIEEMKSTYNPRKLFLWQNPFGESVCKEGHPEIGKLCYLGTIEPRKGLIYLLEAMQILKERGVKCEADLMGKEVDAGYAAMLREYVAKHDLPVRFRGFVDDAMLNEIMSRSDIFVFPSLLEGFGRVLVEANAYGLPVVCFDNSAMPFTIKTGDNGILCENENPEAMADAIQKITEDRGYREILSEGAYRCAQKSYKLEDMKKDIDNDLDRFLK